MKKALIAACITAFVSLPAWSATLYDSHIERSMVDLATTGSTQAERKIYLLMLDHPDTQHRLFSIWSEHEEQVDYPQQWGELGLNLLRWSDSERSFDWKNSVKIDGVEGLVYQQDSLVDIDRVGFGQISYPEVRASNGFTIKDTRSPIRPETVTSLRLLADGRAPIGPDNRPIEVCRMGQGSASHFIEMSYTQKRAFQQTTDLNFDRCLSGPDAHRYWTDRLADFRDRFHDTLPNHNPGQSR